MLRAGGALPDQLTGAELFRCEKFDEAVLSLRLQQVKESARYTVNHEVLSLLETKDTESPSRA